MDTGELGADGAQVRQSLPARIQTRPGHPPRNHRGGVAGGPKPVAPAVFAPVDLITPGDPSVGSPHVSAPSPSPLPPRRANVPAAEEKPPYGLLQIGRASCREGDWL